MKIFPSKKDQGVKKIDVKKTKESKNNLFVFLAKYGYTATILIIIVILCWLMYFLYKNVYQTLAQAELVTQLKQKVLEEDLEESKFTEVVKKLELKTQPLAEIKITSSTASSTLKKNPFLK